MKVTVIKMEPRDTYTMLYVQSLPHMPDVLHDPWRRHVKVTNEVAATLAVGCNAEYNPEPFVDTPTAIFQQKSFVRCV